MASVPCSTSMWLIADDRILWSERFAGVRLRLNRFNHGLTAGNGIEYFLPVNRHFLRCLDSQADLVAADFHDNDRDVVVDDDAFVFFPRQDQH